MREMRRKERATTREAAVKLLGDCEFAVLSMTGTDGNPYAVPVSPVLDDGDVVYIHCAPEGYKLECIAHNPNVSLVCADHITRLPEQFSTAYQSAIASGTASLVQEDEEKIHALRLITEKYAASSMPEFMDAVRKSLARTFIIKIKLNAVSGKQKKLPANYKPAE